MSNYDKMRRTNRKIKTWLEDNNYKNIHLFPHTRFIKDVTIDKVEFDGICTNNKFLVLFQCKSNRKPSKKLLEVYRKLTGKYGIICLYLSNFDRKGVICFQ